MMGLPKEGEQYIPSIQLIPEGPEGLSSIYSPTPITHEGLLSFKSKTELVNDLRSFRRGLHNSLHTFHEISMIGSHPSQANQSLFSSFAVYGIPEGLLRTSDAKNRTNAQIIYCSQGPSELMIQAATLMYPSGGSFRIAEGSDAEKQVQLLLESTSNSSKAFMLVFEPERVLALNGLDSPQTPFQIMNPQGRFYAICVPFEDFTVLSTEKELLKVAFSVRTYCAFSKYPLYRTIKDILVRIINNIYSLKRGFRALGIRSIDSGMTVAKAKTQFEECLETNRVVQLMMDRQLQFKVGTDVAASLHLDVSRCRNLCSEDWCWSVLSLFTLDVFLEVFTFVLLEEKIIFVSEDKQLLTLAVFLFTKVFIRPFHYPYPVVSIIPDECEYLNAPFPIVYGYCKSANDLLKNKIPRNFRNVYVLLDGEVRIHSEDDRSRLLKNKSPRLRDKLMPLFAKMGRSMPSATNRLLSFLSVSVKAVQTSSDYSSLCKLIIDEVLDYMQKEIYAFVPSPATVDKIRTEVLASDPSCTQYIRKSSKLTPKGLKIHSLLHSYQLNCSMCTSFLEGCLSSFVATK